MDLNSSVAPNQSKTFSFYLSHLPPNGVGTTVDAFYRMENASSVLFGEENGDGIPVVQGDPPCQLFGALSPAPSLEVDPESSWLAGMVLDRTLELPLHREALESGGYAAMPFSYLHDEPRMVDVVLRFDYDPSQLSPAALVPGEGAGDLIWEAGLVRPGEYWARVRGPVPAGSGQIALFPFRLAEGARVSESMGSLTLYHP